MWGGGERIDHRQQHSVWIELDWFGLRMNSSESEWLMELSQKLDRCVCLSLPIYMYNCPHCSYIHTYIPATIRLSACPIKCSLLLSALFFIDVKIMFKRFTLFHDKIHRTKLKLCSNNQKTTKWSIKIRFLCSFAISYQNHVKPFAYF